MSPTPFKVFTNWSKFGFDWQVFAYMFSKEKFADTEKNKQQYIQ